MSSVKIGKIAPFPPLPGQPYPPARNHPRWKELYRLHDEWLMKYWPFSSEKKRARIPFMNLAGFSTWCAPAADFDRMVWGGRMAGIFFLADDYVDTAKMHDRIPGFKAAATGNGPLHPEDRAEICHDIVFRAVKATGHIRTFNQLTVCTHEWWDSNIHEPFRNLDQYLATRRVNIAMYFANSYFRYTLDINLTDEQVNHPLMREAEGIVSDHVGLTNDLFSYVKETMSNSDDTNVLRMLQDFQKITYEEAKEIVIKKIRQKEQDFIPAGLAVLNDPELGKDPEVRRWIACLPYCMGGNNAWSQESGRYNVGDVPGGVPFPKLSYEVEETPPDEVVDDAEESRIRDRIFGVEDIPPPDFSLDTDPIEGGQVRTVTESAVLTHVFVPSVVRPRPEDVGILAIDVYLPRRCVSLSDLGGFSSDEHTPGSQEYIAYVDDLEDINSIALSTVSSLLEKFKIDPGQIGYLDVCTETTISKSKSVRSVLLELFKECGNTDIEGNSSRNGCSSSAAALFNAVNWVESSSWDGRNAIVFAGDIGIRTEGATDQTGGVGAVAILIGPNAPLVIEPSRGTFVTDVEDSGMSDDSYLAAFERSFATYKRKETQEIKNKGLGSIKPAINGSKSTADGVDNLTITNGTTGINGSHVETVDSESHAPQEPVVSMLDFDYMIYNTPHGDMVQWAHSCLHRQEYLARPDAPIYARVMKPVPKVSLVDWINGKDRKESFRDVAKEDYRYRVAPSQAISKRCGDLSTGALFGGIASLVEAVPSYELFEHRMSLFEYPSGGASSFFVIHVKADTKLIRDSMDLTARLTAIRVTSKAEYNAATKLREASYNAMPYKPIGPVDGLLPGTYYLESVSPQGQRKYAVCNR